MASHERCESYFLFHGEKSLSDGTRTFVYLLGLAYCFVGLSAITARFFQSMENIVKQTWEVMEIDPLTNARQIKQEKVWNYVIADITLLAFGTSFPQISIATIDAIRNIGQLNAGGMLFSDIVTELNLAILRLILHLFRYTFIFMLKCVFLHCLLCCSWFDRN